MFTDIGLSRELTEKFTGYLESQNKKLDSQMQIQVLQAGAWPLTANAALEIPTELQPSIQLFEEFYARNYSGRKLSWLYNLATGNWFGVTFRKLFMCVNCREICTVMPDV